jgi:hypothetical protein
MLCTSAMLHFVLPARTYSGAFDLSAAGKFVWLTPNTLLTWPRTRVTIDVVHRALLRI